MARRAIQTGQSTIREGARRLRQERNQEFQMTQSGLDAIFGNLSTTTRGIGRKVSAAQARQLEAVQKLARRAAKGQSQVAGVRRELAGKYGTDIGVGSMLGTARAVAKAGERTLRGQAAGSRILARGASEAVQVAQAGAAEARAGADFALAQAYAYRAREDARLIMEQKLALQQQRLAFQLWKRQQDYLAKLEGQSGGRLQGIRLITNTAADAVAGLREAFNNPQLIAQLGRQPNAREAADAYIQEYGITDQNQAAVIYALASAMYRAGAGPQRPGDINYQTEIQDILLDAVTQTLSALYPNLARNEDDIRKTIQARLAIAPFVTRPGSVTEPEEEAQQETPTYFRAGRGGPVSLPS